MYAWIAGKTIFNPKYMACPNKFCKDSESINFGKPYPAKLGGLLRSVQPYLCTKCKKIYAEAGDVINNKKKKEMVKTLVDTKKELLERQNRWGWHP